jgi:hypothetical protein
MNQSIRKYLSEIGRKGGQAGCRKLTSEQARDMVRVREARKVFKEYYASCFWSFDPEYKVTLSDLPWVSEQLMKNGNRKAYWIGRKLCP